ncbi:SRPBCC family protein [Viridibacillus arvi]|uniref:SRPBCC family protein n=1 Tax=Viridibacillus arvi TaxID=263475 RepID=UPI00368A89C2
MWKYEHSIITEATPDSIWELYRNISEWTKWDKDVIDVKLDGPFDKGVTGCMTLTGQEPFLFTLTEVKENEFFSNTTVLERAGIQLDFHHRIERHKTKTKVTHSVVISGSNAEMIGNQIGPMITKGIPNSMTNLEMLARGDIS